MRTVLNSRVVVYISDDARIVQKGTNLPACIEAIDQAAYPLSLLPATDGLPEGVQAALERARQCARVLMSAGHDFGEDKMKLEMDTQKNVYVVTDTFAHYVLWDESPLSLG